jgi:hypothetical protein
MDVLRFDEAAPDFALMGRRCCMAGRTRCIGLVVGALALCASSASARGLACVESADAVRRQYPGAWPSWTLRAAGQEGRKCWYASTRASAHDHNHLVVVGRGTEAAETIEPSTEGFETRHQIASPPQLMSDATRLGDALETRVRTADVGDGAAAVTGSIVSDPATHPADQITDRWPTRVDTRRAAAEATQGPEPVRQLSVAASAPAASDHLPVGGVLAIFAAGLVLASIAARFVFKLSKVLPI